MKNRVICIVFGGIGILSISPVLDAQTVSVVLNQPAQRDSVIAAGNEFLTEREKPIVSDKNAPDPFIGKIQKAVEVGTTVEAPVVRTIVNEAELLRNLANHMAARGTAIMGNDRFLLLSQKRLKVGESIIINFDGKDYEVWLTEVTSTTFTIRRNELSHTRAVLLAR